MLIELTICQVTKSKSNPHCISRRCLDEFISNWLVPEYILLILLMSNYMAVYNDRGVDIVVAGGVTCYWCWKPLRPVLPKTALVRTKLFFLDQ